MTNKPSSEYYDMLVDLSQALIKLTNKLENASILENTIFNSDSDISNFVSIDLYKIASEFTSNDINVNDWEATVFNAMRDSIANTDCLTDISYETFIDRHKDEDFKEIGVTFLGIMKNFLELDLIKSEFNLSDNNPLTLPLYLKNLNSDLFQEYATILYRYAEIISKINGNVSDKEELILKNIYQYLHTPNSTENFNKSLEKGEMINKPSSEYFDLIMNLCQALISLTNKLKNTSILDDTLMNVPNGIAGLVSIDMYTIKSMFPSDNEEWKNTVFMILKSGVEDLFDTSQYSYDFFLTVNDDEDFNEAKKSVLIATQDLIDVFKPNLNINSEKPLYLPEHLKNLEPDLFQEYATVLYRYAVAISKIDGNISDNEELILKRIYQYLHNPDNIENSSNNIFNSENITKVGHDTSGETYDSKLSKKETLDNVLNELNELVGLHEVKEEINTLINYIKIQKSREDIGLETSNMSYHMIFTGNPGTGKTTVARIIAKIYKHLGILNEGHLVETDRSGLVAEYVGQTAVKVNNLVDTALNGVLFIDEAYALAAGNSNDYGNEAIATLVKRIEDDRDKLVLILAGYTNEMEQFIDTNPGFESRINRFINFPDFTPEELFEIFKIKSSKLEYELTQEAEIKLKLLFKNAFDNKDKSFGNGRFVRNVLESTLENQANRISREPKLTKEILIMITEQDIIES